MPRRSTAPDPRQGSLEFGEPVAVAPSDVERRRWIEDPESFPWDQVRPYEALPWEVDPLTNEVWRPVRDCPLYEVSSFGQIRSCVQQRGAGKSRRTEFSDSPKLLRFVLSSDRRRCTLLVDRTPKLVEVRSCVLAAFSGIQPPEFVPTNLDGDPSNDRLDNVRLIAPSPGPDLDFPWDEVKPYLPIRGEPDPLINEVWRPVRTHPGYEVSSFGRVRTWRANGRIAGKYGRWLVSPVLVGFGHHQSGYMTVGLTCETTRVSRIHFVHVLVLTAFVGSRPARLLTRHVPDSDKTNNRLDNLRWGTHQENMIDATIQKTNPRQVLTVESVEKIWARLLDGERVSDIAKSLGIGRASIDLMKSGKTWGHVTSSFPALNLHNR